MCVAVCESVGKYSMNFVQLPFCRSIMVFYSYIMCPIVSLVSCYLSCRDVLCTTVCVVSCVVSNGCMLQYVICMCSSYVSYYLSIRVLCVPVQLLFINHFTDDFTDDFTERVKVPM